MALPARSHPRAGFLKNLADKILPPKRKAAAGTTTNLLAQAEAGDELLVAR